jgi:MoaA/NifB/PqqE/SkfB family radical SAM enzyme/transposase
VKHFLSFRDRPLIREADALRDQCRWEEAIALYRRIVARSPHRAGVWVQIGHSLRKLARYDEALAAYQAADRQRPDDADTLFHLAFILRYHGRGAEAQAMFDRILTLENARPDTIRATLLASRHGGERPDRFDHIILGTTGTCNASCIHCPTGKLSTANSPRNPMPMPLFRKIIDEIADSGMPVAGQIAFGLFGDSLADPFVVERARYLRQRLPDVMFDLNTNGAAYDPKKHAELNDYVSVVTLHCESLIPETYDYLMQPLRAKRVHVKFPMIFRDFPNKVQVAVPMSKLNVDERPAMFDYFYKLGALNVDFAPMSNRLANDEELFDRLSFAPVPISCAPDIFYNLIVDCDGAVLACCNDFSRVEPVGNLATDSLADTLAHQKRKAFADKLAAGCHSEISTCNRCRGDLPQSIPPIDQKLAAIA